MRLRKKSRDANSDSSKILTEEAKDKSKGVMPPELEIQASEETSENETEKGVDERQLEEELEVVSNLENGPIKEKKAEDI